VALIILLTLLLFPTSSIAGGKMWTSDPGGPSNIINLQPRTGFTTETREQQIRKGTRDKPPRMTVCRLAGRKIVRSKKICVYKGAQNTNETAVVEKFDDCPKDYMCVYEPNSSEVSIYDVFDSLADSIK
tara:strand:- start:2275 stop:2661 length:387 start_codon:yes stop_codon:yes gene_type:complete